MATSMRRLRSHAQHARIGIGRRASNARIHACGVRVRGRSECGRESRPTSSRLRWRPARAQTSAQPLGSVPRPTIEHETIGIPSSLTAWATFRWLLSLLRDSSAWRLVPAVALTFAGKSAGIAAAVFFKKAVDAVMSANQSAVVAALLLSGMLKALKAISGECRQVTFAPLSQRISRKLSVKIFDKLLGLDASFHSQRQTGGVINVVERGARAILTFFRTTILTLAPTLIEWALVCGFVAHRFSVTISAVLGATFVTYIAWTIYWTQIAARQRKEANAYDRAVSSKLADALLNYETVVLSNNAKAELGQYDCLLSRFQHFSLQLSMSGGALNAGQGVVIAAGMTACLVLTAQGCFAGAMSLGDIVLVQSLLLQLLEPLQFLGWYYSSLKTCLVDLDALLEILTTPTEVADGPAAFLSAGGGASKDAAASAPGLAIALDGVRFAYDPARPILRGVSLAVRPGESVAIVGPSGSGKSTLLRLILRLYDPTEGAVTIDGEDLRGLTLESLRATMALIPQGKSSLTQPTHPPIPCSLTLDAAANARACPHRNRTRLTLIADACDLIRVVACAHIRRPNPDTLLFNATLVENVRYGDLSADSGRVAEAIRGARLEGLVASLPEGLETVVGERGIKLSGGERQRIAIARAILRQPRLLVSDEATSSLDSHTEAEVMRTLREVGAGRTCVFVSHRLSTVQHCDTIYVMNAGRIVEQGSHHGLLRAGGAYQRMWERQEKEQEEEVKGKGTRETFLSTP